MQNSILGRALIVGGIIAAACFFVFLSVPWNSKPSPHAQSKFRLMCWLPNGEVFYNGTASKVIAQGWGLTFVPDVGPQAGMVINTTNACTWAKL